MAKKKAAKIVIPLVSECWTVPRAAEQLGVARSTLATAIARGAITTYSTACGREMVLLADCEAFITNTPGRGFKDPEVRRKAGETRGERTSGDE